MCHVVPSLHQPLSLKLQTVRCRIQRWGLLVLCPIRSARFNPAAMWTKEHRWLHSPMFLWWIMQSQLWSQRRPPKSDTSRKKQPQVCIKSGVQCTVCFCSALFLPMMGSHKWQSVYVLLQVRSFRRKTFYIDKKIASRMCSRPPTSALPIFLCTSLQPFRLVVVFWWWLVVFPSGVGGGDVLWCREAGCEVTWGNVLDGDVKKG